MSKYNVAILGLGAIFNRHLAAITNNKDDYNLIGIYDPINELKDKYSAELNVKGYLSEDEVYLDPNVNCVVILTPSHLHYAQAVSAMEHKKHVIIEKPATFRADEINQLNDIAKANNVEIFCILQVRLNPTVLITKEILQQKLLGDIRGVSLIQRWQRPVNYFSGWRGSMQTGGGVLREFGIHYLDIMQYLVGQPTVSFAKFFQKKFTAGDVSDVAYGILEFNQNETNSFGGSFEVSLVAEPKNLECTLSIMGSQGFLKLGGKSLDEIVAVDFLGSDAQNKYTIIKNDIESNQSINITLPGASPYHPELYRQIIINPKRFALSETYNVIKLVEDAYSFLPNE
jgi:UDP-N-acetyl-2-amino-2-deoxyglucuronate dehydrogenase